MTVEMIAAVVMIAEEEVEIVVVAAEVAEVIGEAVAAAVTAEVVLEVEEQVVTAEAVAAVDVVKNHHNLAALSTAYEIQTLIDWLFKSSKRCYSPSVRNIANNTKAATVVWLLKVVPSPSDLSH